LDDVPDLSDDALEPPLAVVSVEPGMTGMDDSEEPRLLLAGATGLSAPPPVPAARFERGLVSAEPSMLARGQAAGIDLVGVVLLALLGYAALGLFWAPLAVASLLYSIVATVLLGRTPGSSLIAGAVPTGPRVARSPWTQTPATRDRVPAPLMVDVPDIPDPRETREAREAVEALEVLTLESLS
jgi:hypothetical protein